MMWVRPLVFIPRGMGRMGETSLQKPDKFFAMMESGISGYTLDNTSLWVGCTRGVSSTKLSLISRPCKTASSTSSLVLRYTAIRPLEIREAWVTWSGLIDCVMTSKYELSGTLSFALRTTPLSRVSLAAESLLLTKDVEFEGPAKFSLDWLRTVGWVSTWLAMVASLSSGVRRSYDTTGKRKPRIIPKRTS